MQQATYSTRSREESSGLFELSSTSPRFSKVMD